MGYERPNFQSRNDAFVITPSDATVLNPIPSYIYVGGAGDVTVTTEKGTLVTFKAPPVGTILPIRCTKVMAATTASQLLGLI